VAGRFDVKVTSILKKYFCAQMKERLGPKACLEAIMLMMKEPESKDSDQTSVKDSATDNSNS